MLFRSMFCCPCFLMDLAFTPLIVVIVSSMDKPPFRQLFMTLNISSAVSSLCVQLSHIAPWSSMNSIMVKATMISLGVCGSGPIGCITCLTVSLLGTIQTSLQPILSTTIRGIKVRPIRKEGQQTIIGYQVEHAIIQEYSVSNDHITASVYSQHVTILHR